MSDVQPQQFNIEELLRSLSLAFVAASRGLSMESAKLNDFSYHIPEASIDIRLSLAMENGKVKGIFHKTTSSTSQELESKLSLRIVATPKKRGLGEQ